MEHHLDIENRKPQERLDAQNQENHAGHWNSRKPIGRSALADLSNTGHPSNVLVWPGGKVSQPQLGEAIYSTQTRNIRLDNVLDLDIQDLDDPLMVSEYAGDIFTYLRELELTLMPDAEYMARQGELSWRARSVLVDWMVEIHSKLKLLPETLFLAVNLVDRFLSIRTVSVAKIQLVGISATLIASKFEEILTSEIGNFVVLSDGGYSEEEILRAECYMLNALEFRVSYPTPYIFLRRISKADHYDIQTRTLAKYFVETSLLEPEFLKYPPSLIASASLYLARKLLSRGDWNATLTHYSGYRDHVLDPVSDQLLANLAWPIKHETIYQKYACRRFMRASLFVRDYIARHARGSGQD